jgi:hypothetical protein
MRVNPKNQQRRKNMHTPESEYAWGLKETRLTTKSVKIGSASLTSNLAKW